MTNKAVNVVVIGNKVDLAVDGVYLGSKQPYVPVGKVPGWSWAFVVLSLVAGWLFSAILGVCIGLFASMFYVKSALAIYQSVSRRVVNCIIIFLISSAVQVALGFVATHLLSR